MKRLIFVALMLFVPVVGVAEKPNPADYGVTIHVHASTTVNGCSLDPKSEGCGTLQKLTATIDGMPMRQYELERFASNLLRVGDYKARVVEDVKPRAEEYTLVYEVLLSDGKTGRFAVTGESE